MRASGVPVVALRHVTKRFPGVVANDDVSIDVHAGEVHVLLGENGAGKSTLVAMLAGLQQPDDGSIELDGRRVAVGSPGQSLALGIGTVFQHSMLVPSLTVAENFALGGVWWKRPRRSDIARKIRDTASRLEMRVDPDALVGTLSLGERQQAEILRAMMRGNRCLVLDEPTAMLTPREAIALGKLMRRLAGEGEAIIFITHKLDEALAYGDRISVLRHARKVGEIEPETLRGASYPESTQRIIQLMFGISGDHAAGRRASSAGPSHHIVLDVNGVCAQAGRIPLQDVTFSVRAGEIFGIAGIDGNGQRELAETLAGQMQQDKGSIRLSGREISREPVAQRRRLGLRYVTDDRLGEATAGTFSVAMNLLLKDIGEPPFWQRGVVRPQEILRHAERQIHDFDIRTPGPDTPVGKLSGGNIQKVVLARELTGASEAVIFAKPTYGLDVSNTRAIRMRIGEAAAAGKAVVLISTDLDELLELSDRIAVIDRGRLRGIVENDEEARDAIARLMSDGGAR